MKEILFASSNQGKIREVRQVLNFIKIITPTDILDSEIEIEETGSTFEENALIKAKTLADMSSRITLAEDSGLSVDALNGDPGIYSARYAPTWEECNQKLLKNLEGVERDKRTAKFISVFCLYDPISKTHHFSRGEVEGIITIKPVGENGFGYDPVFYSPRLKKTFAQATSEEKNRVSHRRIALSKIGNLIKKIKQ